MKKQSNDLAIKNKPVTLKPPIIALTLKPKLHVTARVSRGLSRPLGRELNTNDSGVAQLLERKEFVTVSKHKQAFHRIVHKTQRQNYRRNKQNIYSSLHYSWQTPMFQVFLYVNHTQAAYGPNQSGNVHELSRRQTLIFYTRFCDISKGTKRFLVSRGWIKNFQG